MQVTLEPRKWYRWRGFAFFRTGIAKLSYVVVQLADRSLDFLQGGNLFENSVPPIAMIGIWGIWVCESGWLEVLAEVLLVPPEDHPGPEEQ